MTALITHVKTVGRVQTTSTVTRVTAQWSLQETTATLVGLITSLSSINFLFSFSVNCLRQKTPERKKPLMR